MKSIFMKTLPFPLMTSFQVKPIPGYQYSLEKLDEILNADLAATLAGLTLAALALLISMVYPLRDRISKLEVEMRSAQTEEYRRGLAIEKELYADRLTAAGTIIDNMYRAFFCFIMFLFETLTLDVAAEKNLALMGIPYALPADLMISGGLILAGIIFMSIGAREMKPLVKS